MIFGTLQLCSVLLAPFGDCCARILPFKSKQWRQPEQSRPRASAETPGPIKIIMDGSKQTKSGLDPRKEEILTKNLAEDIESSNKTRQEFSLISLVKAKDFVYGDEGSLERRFVQKKFDLYKRKTAAQYLKCLDKIRVTPSEALKAQIRREAGGAESSSSSGSSGSEDSTIASRLSHRKSKSSTKSKSKSKSTIKSKPTSVEAPAPAPPPPVDLAAPGPAPAPSPPVAPGPAPAPSPPVAPGPAPAPSPPVELPVQEAPRTPPPTQITFRRQQSPLAPLLPLFSNMSISNDSAHANAATVLQQVEALQRFSMDGSKEFPYIVPVNLQKPECNWGFEVSQVNEIEANNFSRNIFHIR